MSRGFYAKLAASNMRKHRQITVPYLFTGVFMVMMFYMIGALSANPDLTSTVGAATIEIMMHMTVAIVGIFSVIMLFYGNSFLIKRRKKELALYNILGMEKMHIGKMLLWETLYGYLLVLIARALCGVLFSKLIFMLEDVALHLNVGMKFYISLPHLVLTAVLFGGIYLFSFLIHLLQLKTNRLSELLKGGNAGEREPKTKWVLAILGLGCLGVGYVLSLTIENPLQAISTFFVAVLFVIAGTYFTFTAATIALFKMLRKNKAYYYRTRHFTAISGLMFRMKQNAVGLSSICILATMVLVLISVTFSLYSGIEKGVDDAMLGNMLVTVGVKEDTADSVTGEDIFETLAAQGYETSDAVDFYYFPMGLLEDGNTFYMDWEEISGDYYGKYAYVYLITTGDYEKLTGEEVSLAPGHVLAGAMEAEALSGDVRILDEAWSIDGDMDTEGISYMSSTSASYGYALVAPDMGALYDMAKQYEAYGFESRVLHSFHFDVAGDEDTQNDAYWTLVDQIPEILPEGDDSFSVKGRARMLANSYQFYGTFFFIGIFLAIVFMMGTALIIYYKQVSEGYENRERYQIMQKVGMSLREVRGSIQSQILIVFFLPLGMAAAHVAAAGSVLRKLLMCFNMVDISAFVPCTVISLPTFGAIYGIVYSLTAKAYYKIVTVKQL